MFDAKLKYIVSTSACHNDDKSLKCQTAWTPTRPRQNVGPDLRPNSLQRVISSAKGYQQMTMSCKGFNAKLKYGKSCISSYTRIVRTP